LTATNGERDADRTRIDIGRKADVVYWTKRLGVSRTQLATLIKQVGNSAAAIRRELRK
jgi:hypothetical protein